MRPVALALAGSLLAAAWGGPAQAATGADCEKARTPTEKALCADPALQQADAQLAQRFAATLKAQPVLAAWWREGQRAWLRQRDGCGADAACLLDRYGERNQALARAHRAPSAAHMAARDALLRLIDAAKARDMEFPIEQALAPLALEGETSFSNEPSPTEPDGDAMFPKRRPDGVTADEWTALVRSQIDPGGENGSASYRLLDLDGDGRRDVVVDSYAGGTGLFNHVHVRRRVGDRFVPVQNALYSLNARGANQAATWIRLQGRVYVTYSDNLFGVDRLYLLDPLDKDPDVVPAIEIRYTYYNWRVPTEQRDESQAARVLAAHERAILEKAVTESAAWLEHQVSAQVTPEPPLCPIPETVPENERGEWSSYGPGHYSFEVVTDMAVWRNGQCHLGRLIDWFGRYERPNGLLGLFWLRRPGQVEQTEQQFNVYARRRTIAIQPTLKLFTER